jgi:hypothetical protein
VHAVTSYVEVDMQLKTFVASTLDGVSGQRYSRGNSPVTH